MQNVQHHTDQANLTDRLSNLILVAVAILTGLPTIAALLHTAVKVF